MVAKDGGDLVAIEVVPGAVGKARVHADAVGVGITGQDDADAVPVGELPGRGGGVGHLRIGRLEGNGGKAAVEALVGGDQQGKAEPFEHHLHGVHAAAAQRRIDHRRVGPGRVEVPVKPDVGVDIGGREVRGATGGSFPTEGPPRNGRVRTSVAFSMVSTSRWSSGGDGLAAVGVVDLDAVVVRGIVRCRHVDPAGGVQAGR